MPSRTFRPGGLWATLAAVLVGLAGVFSFRERGRAAE
jgi:hypothetical protein